jgi:hypothetical protein
MRRKGQETELTNTHRLKFLEELGNSVGETVHMETTTNLMLLNKSRNERNTF